MWNLSAKVVDVLRSGGEVELAGLGALQPREPGAGVVFRGRRPRKPALTVAPPDGVERGWAVWDDLGAFARVGTSELSATWKFIPSSAFRAALSGQPLPARAREHLVRAVLSSPPALEEVELLASMNELHPHEPWPWTGPEIRHPLVATVLSRWAGCSTYPFEWATTDALVDPELHSGAQVICSVGHAAWLLEENGVRNAMTEAAPIPVREFLAAAVWLAGLWEAVGDARLSGEQVAAAHAWLLALHPNALGLVPLLPL